MKAITLHEPWATLIAVGVKKIETRSWPPPKSLIGQRIAIHAARRKVSRFDLELLVGLPKAPYGYWKGSSGVMIPIKPGSLGKVLATAQLADAWQVAEVIGSLGRAFHVSGKKWAMLDRYGDFSVGRWLWFLEDIQPLDTPAPATGRQGFWNWEGSNEG